MRTQTASPAATSYYRGNMNAGGLGTTPEVGHVELLAKQSRRAGVRLISNGLPRLGTPEPHPLCSSSRKKK